MKRTWIKNARIVNEGKTFYGSVVIADDTIAEIWEGQDQPSEPCEETVDAAGCYLIPGVIDDHVHFRDPGLTHKADIHSESMAAAAGGVTSYMDMPNTNPQTTTLEALENKFKEAATKSIVNYSFYFGATNKNADLLSQLDKSESSSKWLDIAEKQLRSLSSPAYMAGIGEQGGFIIKHGVGHLRAGGEVDVPLSYGDYYYIEALLRYKKLLAQAGK